MKPHKPILTAACAFALLIPAGRSFSQEAPAAAPPKDQPAQVLPKAPDAQPPKSLDDLLGLPKEEQSDSAAAAAEQDAKAELDRQLAEAEIADAFAQAVAKMALSAELLDVKFDAGVGTQRVQEEIIAKLATLIDAARKKQCSGSSSSSSSCDNPSQQQSQAMPKTGEKPGQPKPAQPKPGTQAADAGMGPSPQDANPNAPIEQTAKEWGNLPERFREMILQGRSDKFSAMYRKLTDEYYKRLAEENGP
jgi:hypothetical protein